MCIRLLQKLGIEPHLAVNGKEAVDFAKELSPDLILMDCNVRRVKLF